jgi:acetoin utilization protein AcuB
MTANPYTIEKEASITDAVALMHEKGLRRLPVVQNGKAVGIITKGDIQTVSPTKATTLSIYEVNYLLSKTSVADVMTKDVITVSPDALLEDSAVLMRDNQVSGLVVVDDDDNVVGIITESNIFDAFIEMFGMNKKGTRISVEVSDKTGVLAEISAIFTKHGANILNMVVYSSGTGNAVEIVFRTSSLNTSGIENDLKDADYKVLSVIETTE